MASEQWVWEAAQLECARRGWEVERTNFQVGRRSADLFGFVDCIASAPADVCPHRETVAIQYTSCSNLSARVKKVKASPHLLLVLGMGWRVLVWGFETKGSDMRLREVEVEDGV